MNETKICDAQTHINKHTTLPQRPLALRKKSNNRNCKKSCITIYRFPPGNCNAIIVQVNFRIFSSFKLPIIHYPYCVLVVYRPNRLSSQSVKQLLYLYQPSKRTPHVTTSHIPLSNKAEKYQLKITTFLQLLPSFLPTIYNLPLFFIVNILLIISQVIAALVVWCSFDFFY